MAGRAGPWIALAAIGGVILVYVDTLTFGLTWDDYAMLRPRGWADIAAAATSNWDPWQIWLPAYRPLTVAYYALTFHLFGLNSWALHTVSLAEMAGAAWLIGVFVRRETVAWLGVVAALVYAVHPALALAEGAAFTRQHHMLASMMVTVGLLLWQERRATPSPRAWWPIFCCAAVAFAIKEDAALLLLGLLVAQAVRARTLRDVPPPGRALTFAVWGFLLALGGLRLWALGGAGSPPVASTAAMLTNFVRGPVRSLVVFQDEYRPLVQLASAAAIATMAAGLWALVSRRAASAAASSLVITGTSLLLAFNLPLLFVTGSTRYYLVAVSAVLILSGAISAMPAFVINRAAARTLVAVWTAVVTLALASASRASVATLAPCTAEQLSADRDVQTWTAVPPALRLWLTRKAWACSRNAYQPLETSLDAVVWGADDSASRLEPYGPTAAAGRTLTGLVNGRARVALLEMRVAPTSPDSSVNVHLRVNGGSMQTDALSRDWRTIALPLRPTIGSRLRRMHRVEVSLDAYPDVTIELGGLRAVR